MTNETQPCPQCGAASVMTLDNAFMPFCSRRCKDADFLHWANDAHRIPGASTPWEASNEDY